MDKKLIIKLVLFAALALIAYWFFFKKKELPENDKNIADNAKKINTPKYKVSGKALEVAKWDVPEWQEIEDDEGWSKFAWNQTDIICGTAIANSLNGKICFNRYHRKTLAFFKGINVSPLVEWGVFNYMKDNLKEYVNSPLAKDVDSVQVGEFLPDNFQKN